LLALLRLQASLPKKGTRLAITLLSLLVIAGGAQTASPFPGPRGTCAGLPGLKGVTVVVDLETPAGAPKDMSREDLQTEIESRIHQAGITVLPRQICPLPGVPLIYVNIKVAFLEEKYAYNIDLMCLTASQDEAIKARVGNCRLEVAGLVPEIRQVKGKVEELVKVFIKDYLSRGDQSRPIPLGRDFLLLTGSRA